ncbi:MAG: hypothetical protein JWM74_4848 [Myxococcaceae bacterium]|nr:hypothetical protein [Myxococcaceae bacterium]
MKRASPREKKSAPEVEAPLPVAFVPASNGETVPRPKTKRDRFAEETFARIADENARRLGVSRREFVSGACGIATGLWVVNQLYGCKGGGARYDVDAASTLDAARACEKLAGGPDDFVFDVQTHHVNPAGKWREDDPALRAVVAGFPYSSCGEADPIQCFGADHFIREIFVKSDTAVACLTGLPADPARDPLTTEDRAVTRDLVEKLSGSPRLLLHANVVPERGSSALDAMQAAAERQKVSAWKVYPSAGSWRFDDEKIAIPFIEKARTLGVKIICAHRGVSGDAGGYLDFSSPREMVKTARAYPDVAFLVYHSGWEPSIVEGAYDEANPRGIDRLIFALREFPTTNVYAELGTTWRGLLADPTQAAHALGKLLLHLGEDRILWGTDCIWYGSPQEQLAAFRAFDIPVRMQEDLGYPALSASAKRKILGLNAARVYGVDPAAVRCKIANDDIVRLRHAMLDGAPLPSVGHHGPRTRRELFTMLRARG